MEERRSHDIEYGELKQAVKNVCQKVDLIINNHLPHIQERLDKLYYWIIGLLVAVLLQLLGIVAILVTKR